MKSHIQTLITQSLQKLQQTGLLPSDINANIVVEHARDKKFGDFASNIAMILAKSTKTNPRDLAVKIIENLPSSSKISKAEIAGPGFINFFVQENAFNDVVAQILQEKQNFGRNQSNKEELIHIEFVSSNPTGPLHVGHGRSAAFGSALCHLLRANGARLHTEYYVNDAGRQMNILATSVFLRYLELLGEKINFPRNGYKGDYIADIAQALLDKYGKQFQVDLAALYQDVPTDEISEGQGDKEAHIDGLIANAQQLLGEKSYQLIFDLALETILAGIQHDLADFGVTYDEWFSERSLFNDDFIYKTIAQLKVNGHTYESEGNVWFRSTDFGDDKDRVLIRKNGIPTYFATDISYHLSKFVRGASHVIDVLGSDHHGYIPRVKAAMQALNIPTEKLTFLTVQFAILFRGEERVQMSTRSGSFVTLHDLQEEVGKDAARYFYVMRKNEQHLDFDLELAKSQSNDNPVYYIQYAHARICSVLRQLAEKGLTVDTAQGLANLTLLNEPHEKALIELLDKYPEVVESAGRAYEPHQVCHYLKELANHFHSYYNAHQFSVAEPALRNARMTLILAVKQVLNNGLELLGISAPEAM